MKSWEEFKNNYAIGSKVTGEIVYKAPFGVFLDIGEPFYVLLEIIVMDNLDYKLYKSDKQFKIGEIVGGEVVDFTENNKQMRIKQKNVSQRK